MVPDGQKVWTDGRHGQMVLHLDSCWVVSLLEKGAKKALASNKSQKIIT